jgi:hypothetical protein
MTVSFHEKRSSGSQEGQTTQRPKEKGQKDKQRSTKHTHKTKLFSIEVPILSQESDRSCICVLLVCLFLRYFF